MDFKEIQDLLKLVNKTTLTEVEIEQKDFRLKIRRKAPDNKVVYTTSEQVAPQPIQTFVAPPVPVAEAKPVKEAAPVAPATANEEPESDLVEFRSPMIGTFYRSSSPDIPPFVKVGDVVEAGQVLCIVEAMKLFNEIESEVSGKIVKIVLEDAQPVEYDQVLFLIDPNG